MRACAALPPIAEAAESASLFSTTRLSTEQPKRVVSFAVDTDAASPVLKSRRSEFKRQESWCVLTAIAERKAAKRASKAQIKQHFRRKRRTALAVQKMTLNEAQASLELRRLREIASEECARVSARRRVGIAVHRLFEHALRLKSTGDMARCAQMLWLCVICGERRAPFELSLLLDGEHAPVAQHHTLRLVFLSVATRLEARGRAVLPRRSMRTAASAPAMCGLASRQLLSVAFNDTSPAAQTAARTTRSTGSSRRASMMPLNAALDGRALDVGAVAAVTAVAANGSGGSARGAASLGGRAATAGHSLTRAGRALRALLGSERSEPDAATSAIARAVCSAVLEAERSYVVTRLGVTRKLAALQLDIVDSVIGAAASKRAAGAAAAPIDLGGFPRYTVLDFLALPEQLPAWEMGSSCALCDVRFSAVLRRHHCRNCGRSVCRRHGKRRVRKLEGGRPSPASERAKGKVKTRVCLECFERIRRPRGRTPFAADVVALGFGQ